MVKKFEEAEPWGYNRGSRTWTDGGAIQREARESPKMIEQVETYSYRCLRAVRQRLQEFYVLIGRGGIGASLCEDLTVDLDAGWFVPRARISATCSTSESARYSPLPPQQGCRDRPLSILS